jgi:signal peptidase II
MKKLLSAGGYGIFFVFIVALDFLSKQWALKTLHKEIVINNFFSLELLINRGISWGIFHHAEQPFFIMLSIAISLLVVLLMGYTVFRFIKGFPIYAEMLVVAGATGNLIDRALYNGVIDFAVLHCGPLASPVFNIADSAIIVGIIAMLTIGRD